MQTIVWVLFRDIINLVEKCQVKKYRSMWSYTKRILCVCVRVCVQEWQAGLNFADEDEAKQFYMAVQKQIADNKGPYALMM